MLFSTGTPISTDPKELAICANILSRNERLLPFDSFESLFIDAGGRVAYKDILVKRLAGLVSTMLISTDQSEDYPELRNTQIVQLPMPDAMK